MGIGTSDGKYYEDEMAMVIAEHDATSAAKTPVIGVQDYQLDPTTGPYNDQPTEAAKLREPNVYQDLKNREQQMETQLQNAGPDQPATDPGVVVPTMWKKATITEADITADPIYGGGPVTPQHAKIRLNQLLYDKALTKKSGQDVNGPDYLRYNHTIDKIRGYLRNQPE